MLPQENCDRMRVLLRPSETTTILEVLPQNCLFNLGTSDLSALCMQDMKQDSYRDVRCAKRAVNLRVSRLEFNSWMTYSDVK